MGDELWMQVASVFIPLFGYILVIMIIGTLIDYIFSLFGFSRNWGINYWRSYLWMIGLLILIGLAINLISYNM